MSANVSISNRLHVKADDWRFDAAWANVKTVIIRLKALRGFSTALFHQLSVVYS